MSRLFSVTLLTGLLTLLKMLCGFVVSKFVAIYAGPTGVAMLGQLQSLVTSFTGIINAPVNTPVVRYTAENDSMENRSKYWRASLAWMLIISAILIILIIPFSSALSLYTFSTDDYSVVVVASIAVLPLAGLGTLLNSIINGLENYRKFIYRGMISVIISSVIIVLMVYFNGLKGALFAVAMQMGIIGLIMFAITLKEPWLNIKYWFAGIEKQHVKSVGNYILMAVISALAVPLSMIIIRNDIVANLGWDSAGNWQAVRKISDVYLGVITTALSVYFLPKLSKTKGADNTVKEIYKTISFVLPLSIVLAAAIFLMRDIIIMVLFTKEFDSARDLFLFQLLGDIVKAVSYIFAYPMLARGASKWFIFTEVFFSLTLVSLVHFGIQFYGIEGVNMAYFVNYIFYMIFVIINVKKFSV